MELEGALAAGATLVALGFTGATVERWIDRHRPHEAVWAIALGCFAVASGAAWWGASFGWSAGAFRVFYAFGAVINVPVLALGTWFLLAPPATARVAAVLTTIGVSFGGGVVFAAPLRTPVPDDALPQGSDVFGVLPRVIAAVASSVGAAVLLGGAALTLLRLARRRRRADARLAAANGCIAGGTLVLSAGGLFNSVLGQMDAFALTLVAGIVLLFAGFLITSPPAAPSFDVAPSP